MNLSIIGLGLLGGSLALDLKRRRFADVVYGCDKEPIHASYAQKMGLIDYICDLQEVVSNGDIIVVACPVDAALKIIPQVLDMVGDSNKIVIDVCSTKQTICERVKYHPNRKNFVACHPMAGTEKSGPWAAISNMFDGKAVIMCDTEDSDENYVKIVRKMFEVLNMNPMFFNSNNHDVHVAYVSHLSHITSFALAQTVLEKEKNEKNIFHLASGGFDSTVRLAKSSAEMWVPIFKENNENIKTVLKTYIQKLEDFQKLLQEEDQEGMYNYIVQANRIKKVLNK